MKLARSDLVGRYIVLGLGEILAKLLRKGDATYSSFNPSLATIGPHLSCSAFMCLARSSGVPPRACAPRRARGSFMAADFDASLVASLSLMMIAGGVPRGARIATQAPELMAG